jgi:hydroxymethylpyrimidine pyrophosphatase-like HAD family hydrolase
VQKCFEFPPGTDKNLPKDSTSETFDSLYRVLSVVDEKFNIKKKRKEKEKQVEVEEDNMDKDREKEKQVQVEEEEVDREEEEDKVEDEGSEEGENRKVSVRRIVLTPLNIELMLQNINKDEVIKLLVKKMKTLMVPNRI